MRRVDSDALAAEGVFVPGGAVHLFASDSPPFLLVIDLLGFSCGFFYHASNMQIAARYTRIIDARHSVNCDIYLSDLRVSS